jgi:hypothetical protein
VASSEPLDSSARTGATQDDVLIAAIVEFLRNVGLEAEPGVVDGKTFMPGITVRRGVLVFDPARLEYPGDLLHEAGHLAVKPPAEREEASADMGTDAAEEMMAIAWSYAAALELGIAPEVVFHQGGYRGGSDSLLENFAEGRYLAVPMLEWIGMSYGDKRARELGVEPYPRMTRWLRARPAVAPSDRRPSKAARSGDPEPVESAGDFESFRRLVLADPELQARLRSFTEWPAFVGAVVDAAAEHGIALTAGDVLAARDVSRRARLSEWV